MRVRSFLVALAAASGVLPAAAPADAATAKRARLTAFQSCSGVVSYARRHVLDTLGNGWAPVPSPPFTGAPMPVVGGAEGDRDGAIPAPAASAPESGAVDHSTTNVQEAGVDEPDIVKTDGRRIFALAGATLHAVDARSSPPRLLGSLKLGDGGGHELLLHGDRALVVWNDVVPVADAPVSDAPVPAVRAATTLVPQLGRAVTRLAEVDISDPSELKIVRTLRVDGNYVTGRQTGAAVRVVVASPPHVLEVAAQADAATQRAAVLRARLSGWLPHGLLARPGSARRIKRSLVACRHVRRPAAYSGAGMLTVLTIDLERGLPAIDSDSLMTDAQTVYASPTRLYVATQRWLDPRLDAPPAGSRTAIHEFDISDPGGTSYRASGEVPGFLLNQWSMSEYEGRLRVASTERPTWLPGGGTSGGESFVTVLEERSGALAELGRVGGLGRGELIYAVRFIGNAGFVVTFRQVDPLYTIDLSNPAAPRVLGELELLGYSAYLHPAGEGLLLGVGQDANDQGRLRGTQLSLFDVSDLSNPVRLHQRALGGSSSSEVEYDHRAFLYWEPTALAVLPVALHMADPPFAGAIGFRVDRAAGIQEVGRVAHPGGAFGQSVRRTIVIGDRLFTLSEGGLVASRLDTLGEPVPVAFRAG